MATSGSINFIVTRDDIITEALEQLGVLADGESPSASQLSSMGRKLNMMAKAWQADGLNLFAVQRVYLIPQKNQNEYTLGPSSTDHFTTSLVVTTVSTAAVSGAGSIDVASITGMSDGDNIGIELDDGSIQWTTISGAPSGSTVTLAANLTDDVAAANAVYVYTTLANRPMKILNATLRDVNGKDSSVDLLARRDYVDISDKTQDGDINQIYYDPQISAGKLFVWPEQSDTSKYLVLWCQRTLDDFDAASDDADFPQEWHLPLALNLALVASPAYGITPVEYKKIQMLAMLYYENAASWDTEDYIILQPDVR